MVFVATGCTISAGRLSSAGDHMSTDPTAVIQPALGTGKATHALEALSPGQRQPGAVRYGSDQVRVDPDVFAPCVHAHTGSGSRAPLLVSRDRGEFRENVQALNREGRIVDIYSHEFSVSGRAPAPFTGLNRTPQSTGRDSRV